MKQPTLSVIILSYNTKDLLRACLSSVEKIKKEVSTEVLVIDNASTDGSPEMVKKEFPWTILIESEVNKGFAAGNNLARKKVRGKYILFLNSDTEVYTGTFKRAVEYLESHKDVGALTCKMIKRDGSLDVDARRSFPTPWVALTHLVFRLDRIFPKSKLFARYWYGYISPDNTHEIDVAQGAYVMIRKKILDKINWFDEDYFLDGEDIDLSWRIKKTGTKIVYYPKVKILHVKKASKRKPTKDKRLLFIKAGADSMELFYKKHMQDKYPALLTFLVIIGVRLTKYLRIIRTYLS